MGLLPDYGALFWGEDDIAVIFKNTVDKTVCLALRNCPELLQPKKNGTAPLISLTIRVSQDQKDILDFIAEHGATGVRLNGAAAVVEKHLVFHFTRHVHVIGEEKRKKEE